MGPVAQTCGEPAALPPEQSPQQQAVFAASLLSSLAHEYIPPELELRYGSPVSVYDFLTAPEWQSRVHRVLIVNPREGTPDVRLNEEADGVEIPSGSVHALLVREGYRWRIDVNWLPLFSDQVQVNTHRVAAELASAIISGDEQKAAEMAKLWFPGIWDDSPDALRNELS